MEFREEHYSFRSDIWEDLISVIFTDDIDTSIKDQCEFQGFKAEPYLFGNKSINGCVIDLDEPNYRATWVMFKIGYCDESTIVHEIVHLVRRQLEGKGLKHNKHTTEVFAYTTAFYYKKIMSIYKDNHYDKKKAKVDMKNKPPKNEING